MSDKNYKQWYILGLQALVEANLEAKDGASGFLDKISSTELKEKNSEFAEVYKKHAQTIREMLKDAGGEPSGAKNPVTEGISAAGGAMMESAKTPEIFDAGIIFTAQLGMHYFLAAYGSLASTAKHLGITQQAAKFKSMSDEISAMDKEFTKIAETEVNEKAS